MRLTVNGAAQSTIWREMASPFNPENYRFRAVIDWVKVRVTLSSPSQFRHVQDRLLTIFGKLYIVACEGNASSLRFDITFQDPGGPALIMQGLQSALQGDGPALKESDVQVIGLELALDLYSHTNDPASLAVAALHMAVHHAHPPGRARVTRPKQYFVPVNKREILAELDAGYTLNAGAKNASHTCRYYVKRQDTIDGVPYETLPLSKHRARFENTWQGDLTPPFKTMAEWRNFRFESLSERFALVATTPTTGMAALLQVRSTQLGRTLDKTGDKPRHPDAMAKSRLPNYRRQKAPNTQRDTVTNEKMRQALRNLTDRSKQESPRKFGGFSEPLTPSPIGECLNNVQSPIYLNTLTQSPLTTLIQSPLTNQPPPTQATQPTNSNQSPLTHSTQQLIHQPSATPGMLHGPRDDLDPPGANAPIL